MTDNLREKIFNILVMGCLHVDDCEKKCLAIEREYCYGKQADSILSLVHEAGYRKFPELKTLSDEEILEAWNRTGTSNLYTYQEKGRAVSRAERDYCQKQIEEANK